MRQPLQQSPDFYFPDRLRPLVPFPIMKRRIPDAPWGALRGAFPGGD